MLLCNLSAMLASLFPTAAVGGTLGGLGGPMVFTGVGILGGPTVLSPLGGLGGLVEGVKVGLVMVSF